jgi:hypothetical protein
MVTCFTGHLFPLPFHIRGDGVANLGGGLELINMCIDEYYVGCDWIDMVWSFVQFSSVFVVRALSLSCDDRRVRRRFRCHFPHQGQTQYLHHKRLVQGRGDCSVKANQWQLADEAQGKFYAATVKG